jgi:hypothetical protein
MRRFCAIVAACGAAGLTLTASTALALGPGSTVLISRPALQRRHARTHETPAGREPREIHRTDW